MISKFKSTCRANCGKPIHEGEDIYWTKEESSWHWECWENRKPGPESFRLADELGYTNHADIMAGDRPVLSLPRRAGSNPAGRIGAAPRGNQSSLFGLPEKESA